MVENNMRIWEAVQTTDPKHTKPVNFGRKFTSIDAHWQVMQATKQFGPVGQGWGYHVEHSTVTLAPDMVLAVADVRIWWHSATDDLRGEFGPIRGTCEIWAKNEKKGRMEVDEDAPKKAMTDALTKGLSHLGFSADVFLGKFDDNRYVQKVEREFANGPGGHANRSLGEARADIAAQTGNSKSTYDLTKEKKARDLVKESAKLAIGMCQNRPELKAWIKANKDELAEKLPTADYDAIIELVDARWDELAERAA